MAPRTPFLFPKSLAAVGFAVATVLAISGDHSNAAGATQEPKTMRAAAVVNDIIISTFDLEQRIKLVMVTSGAQGPDAAKRLRPQVLRQLVDELLQLQEASKLKVNITAEEMEKNYKRIAEQNKITVDQINKMLDDNGIARSTLQNQLKADLAWQKIIQGRLASRVTVSDDEVDEALKQQNEAASQTQYLVSEIFIAVDVPEAEDQAKQNVQTILGHLRSGATFSSTARQFSQSASRSNGGDIGWVSEADVPPPVAAAVKKMAPGAVSEAIRATGGYYIIGLREKRLPSGSKVTAAAPPPPKPQAAQKMKSVISIGRIAIAMPGGASKAKQEQVKSQAVELYRTINGCDTAGSVARSRGAKFERIGEMSVKDMAPEFVKILSQTPNGRSTPPLRSQSGVEMFVICSGGMIPAASANMADAGPTVTEAKVLSREDIENRLYQQELSMLARRYLRDLRRDATIEMRDN